MTPTWLGQLGLNWVAVHQQYLIGFVAGIIVTNPVTCASIVFNFALKIPGFGPWVARNPDKAKSWFDDFDKGIDAAVDKYAKAQTTPTEPPSLPPKS